MSYLMFLAAELDILVYWMLERDRIRAKKEAGQPKPWTQDPLLRDYRWCNVRRLDDRVSQWLFEHWYNAAWSPEQLLCAAVLARLINWPDALAQVGYAFPHFSVMRTVLRERQDAGGKVFTGAYIVPGVTGKNKVDSVFELVGGIATSSQMLVKATGMKDLWLHLTSIEGLGSFLAGQIVADLAHLPTWNGQPWPDRATWAPLGPGSARGLNRLRGIPKDKAVSQAEFERALPVLIDELRPRVEDLWADRGLEAMDIQNCLCEFDKYRRLTLGEGKVRNTYNGRAAQASLI